MHPTIFDSKAIYVCATCLACSFLFASYKSLAQTNTITPVVSLSQNRKQSQSLYNRVIEGRVFISISTSAKNIEQVTFWFDDSQGIGKPLNVDKWPPFDLLDRRLKRHNERPMAFDTLKRDNGEHSILIKFDFFDGTSAKILTPFKIYNEDNVPYSERYKRY